MKLLVTFSRKKGREPIIAKVVLETGVLINVERAYIDAMEGEVLIDVPDEDYMRIRDRMTELGAIVSLLEHAIRRDEHECIDCGACVGVCPQEVFCFDEDWKITMRDERCVICGKCLPACPHDALSLVQ